MRRRYQFGTLDRKKRKSGPAVWVFRYTDADVRRSVIVGTVEQYPNKSAARRAAEHLRMLANPDKPKAQVVTFGVLVDRYVAEALPTRHSTSSSYLAWINAYIRPKWADYSIPDVQSGNVELWLKSLELQPKSQTNILSIMRKLWKCAMKWNLVPLSVNPMSLVEIPLGSKRQSKARALTVAQVQSFIGAIAREPFKTMAWLAVGMGLERSTVPALKWEDVDFALETVYIRRGMVDNHEGPTKNDYRNAPLPLHPALAAMLKVWRANTPYPRASDWVFASPYFDGEKPYNPRHVARLFFWPASEAAGLGERLGWQSLRRTYASLVTQLGTDVKVVQELMRHSDIKTTLGLYADAYSQDMKKANAAVVGRMIQ